MYETFLMFPPQTKVLVPPMYTVYTLYLSVVTCAAPKFYTWRTPCSGILSQTNASPPFDAPFDAPLAFRLRSVRVPCALRSRSVCVPSTMNWP